MNQMRMMQQVQKMQAQMAKVQEDLEKEEIEGTAGGGAVKAVVNGSQRLLAVTIDPDLSDDIDMLQDLVVAAVNDASDKSKELAAQRMSKLTAGLGLPPGLI